jgi:hypothetical protein
MTVVSCQVVVLTNGLVSPMSLTSIFWTTSTFCGGGFSKVDTADSRAG